MAGYSTINEFYRVKAENRLNIEKVSNSGVRLKSNQVIKGTGTFITAQWNPEKIGYGKKVSSKENPAAGEYNPPVEILGGAANTLDFVLRLNTRGDTWDVLNTDASSVVNAKYHPVLTPDSDFPSFDKGNEVFFNSGDNVQAYKDLYARLVFLDSLQYPNTEFEETSRYLLTPLVKIIMGNHVPLVWVLNDIRFDLKQFDPYLNIQTVDITLSFKLAECNYNSYIFDGSIPTLFNNMSSSYAIDKVTWEDDVVAKLTSGEKYAAFSKKYLE